MTDFIPESTNATPAGQEVKRVARITAASDALLSKPYLSDNDRDRVRAITAAALATPSVATPADDAGVRDGWNPIATVERANGKRLILAWDDCPSLPYHWEVGRWSRNLGWVNTYGHPFSGEPTHWMEPSSPYAASPKAPSVAIDEHDAFRLRKVAEADCGVRIPAPYDEVADHLATVAFDEAVNRCRGIAPSVAIGAGEVERQWPDIGDDPMKRTPYEDRMAVSAKALREAYVKQQPHVPDQTALVWRWHIAALLEAEIRLRSILADDEAPASASIPADVEQEALRQIAEYDEGDVPDDQVADRIAWIEAELADEENRPVWSLGTAYEGPLRRNGLEIGDLLLERAALIARAALTPASASIPADVEALVIAAREFWDMHNDLSEESAALDKALEAFSSRVRYNDEPEEALAARPSPVERDNGLKASS